MTNDKRSPGRPQHPSIDCEKLRDELGRLGASTTDVVAYLRTRDLVVSARTVQRWLRGSPFPPPRVLELLCGLLQRPREYFELES